jgi:hypothetical protein
MIPFEDDFNKSSERQFVLVPKGRPLPELDENGVWQADTKEDYYEMKKRIEGSLIHFFPSRRRRSSTAR